jgi:hypothetical protein
MFARRLACESSTPGESPDASPAPPEDHPVSFLLDPATSPATVIDLAGQDIWRPVVDPGTRTIVYWSGTLVPDGTGTGWELGTGQLVIDGWFDPAAPSPSPDPSASLGPSATPTVAPTPTPTTSTDPLATPVPTLPPGPAGTPVTLAEGPVSDFDVRFDPIGTHLAVWIRDPENLEIGTLTLYVIDPASGAIDPALDPLPATTALRGFSIDEGRVAGSAAGPGRRSQPRPGPCLVGRRVRRGPEHRPGSALRPPLTAANVVPPGTAPHSSAPPTLPAGVPDAVSSRGATQQDGRDRGAHRRARARRAAGPRGLKGTEPRGTHGCSVVPGCHPRGGRRPIDREDLGA